ncbi:hypothetical protein H6H03_06520 [Nostoc paludosum FACHB-159]|uniref:Uncharacterized protein n=1 Tax=Nostoc paludosum FACHB-159 TaxID=2692908 RepID=A0ABR8K5W3_9NOSO|nr:hypothetical protein [Nostoc paludosum FACHB-159]
MRILVMEVRGFKNRCWAVLSAKHTLWDIAKSSSNQRRSSELSQLQNFGKIQNSWGKFEPTYCMSILACLPLAFPKNLTGVCLTLGLPQPSPKLVQTLPKISN